MVPGNTFCQVQDVEDSSFISENVNKSTVEQVGLS